MLEFFLILLVAMLDVSRETQDIEQTECPTGTFRQILGNRTTNTYAAHHANEYITGIPLLLTV